MKTKKQTYRENRKYFLLWVVKQKKTKVAMKKKKKQSFKVTFKAPKKGKYSYKL